MAGLNLDLSTVKPHEGFGDILSEVDTTTRWSSFQTSIFAFVESGSGNAIVEAVAGSGKSTTIIEAMKLVKGSSIFLAFNKAIADELKAKGVNARTFHSLVFSVVMRAKNANGPTMDKLRQLVRRYTTEDGLYTPMRRQGEAQADPFECFTKGSARMYGQFAQKLVGLARQQGMGFLTENVPASWKAICDHHDLEPEDENATVATGIKWAMKLLDWSNESEMVDFDDMLYWAVKDNLGLPQFDFIFVDEAQDTNLIQREILRKIMGPRSRMIAVGDPCQPAGTMVERVIKNGEFGIKTREMIPIEQLREGDYVASYSAGGRGHVARKVLGISVNQYSRNLLKVEAGDHASRYTMEHQCVVRYQEGGYGLYLMARGSQFRIGITKLDHPQGCGPAIRLRQEDGDAVWILRTFATKREAMVAEIQAITQTGIPGTCWSVTNAHTLTQDELDDAWAGVDNQVAAGQLLCNHGRQQTHPYFIRGQLNCSLRRPHITYACNVLHGSKVMLRDQKWVDAKWCHEAYTGDVYSLTVEKDEVYFADGILTHNCQAIYGFRGADAESLGSIAREFNAQTLPLSISYRCPTSVVKYAQQWVSHIQARDGAPEGVVEHHEQDWEVSMFLPNDLVICRKSAPLLQLAFRCIRNNIPVQVLGREIGDGLKSLIDKVNARTLEQLTEKLQAYMMREVEKARKEDDDAKIEAITDKVGAIIFLIDGLKEDRRDIASLKAGIDYLFKDKDKCVKLCTLHKAKGLEADRVFWLNRNECPAQWARREWQKVEEINLCYVASTRAKRELHCIEI